MKLLFLDIETAPNTAYVWRLFKEYISLDQLLETSYTLCWSAKWFGQNEIMFSSIHETTDWEMLAEIHKLLNEADAVIHFNGKKFDIPILNKEFVERRFTPPSPYKQIDLFEVVKRQFRFSSNKLTHVCKELGIGTKMETPGLVLWKDCMEGKEEAWKLMKEYNMHDVFLTEKLYERVLPWIPNHPNHGLYQDNPKVCPNCGSEHYQHRGFVYTLAGKYQRYQCRDCGKWFKDAATKKNNLAPKASDRFSDA